jgi:Transposase DDE domain
VENQNWDQLLRLLPTNWQQLALDTCALQRLRGFRSLDALLRTLLLHVACGYSLRETVVQARVAGLAQLSDVALLHRLRQAEDWFQSLCRTLLAESGVSSCPETNGRRIRIVDGTIVREPGPTGSQWRLLYSLEWPAVRCDFLDLTTATGVGTGEWLGRVPVGNGDLLLADAGYCSVAGIEYVTRQEAHVLIRVNPSQFPLINAAGERLSLLSLLEPVTGAGQICDWEVRLRSRGEHALAGRLCALRKSEEAIQQARQRLRRKACRKQIRTRAETWRYAEYVIVFSSWPQPTGVQLLTWYRVRWQVELAIKRLKSLLGFGHLPKHDAHSARAWLYGKLLLALLAEKLIVRGQADSPRQMWEPERAHSAWREFGFAVHGLVQAITPFVPLDRMRTQWNEWARRLAEPPRQRKPQVAVHQQLIA